MSLRSTTALTFVGAAIVLFGLGIRATQEGPSASGQSVSVSPSRGATGPSALTGTTGSIGGSLLIAGGCSTGTATVTGAAVGMATIATPATPPGGGAQWQAYVSSANTVTVSVCAILSVTPPSTTYAVRVIQ